MQTIDPRNRTVPILGINVHDVTMTETLDWAESAIADNRPARIATPNAEIVRLAWKNPELKNLLNASDLAIPDGAGLLLAARFYGRRFREQVTGTDLAIELAGLCARRGWRMFLLGAGPGVAEVAADKLRARWPDIQIAGTYSENRRHLRRSKGAVDSGSGPTNPCTLGGVRRMEAGMVDGA